MESQTKRYELDDVSADAFLLLVRWLYTEKIESPSMDHPHASNVESWLKRRDERTSSEREREFQDKCSSQVVLKHEDSLARLWILADRLLIRPLQNYALKKLEELWGEDFPPLDPKRWLNYVYAHTTADSPLRHLVVDRCAYCVAVESIQEIFANIPKEFLLDISAILISAVDSTSKRVIVNGENRPTYDCKRTWRSYLVSEES